jgi:type I restriction enzyme, S subunit
MTSCVNSWTEVTLGEICEFKYGKSLPEARRTGGEISVYGSNGIVGYHNEAITDGMTIIVGRKGSFGEINLSPVSCWSIDTTYYIDRSATDADLRWLAYQLAVLKLTELNKSAAVPGLNREDAYRKKLLLPPIAEQKRIAAILDKAEELRGLRRKALEELDAIVQSIFFEMFGDPIKNQKGWKTLTIGELAPEKGSIVDGPFGSSLKPEAYTSSGVRVIRNYNIHDAFFDQSEFVYVTKKKFGEIYRSHVCSGDILLSTKGTIGDVCIMPNLPEESVLSASGTVRIRLPQNAPLLAEFIVYQMIRKSYKQYLKGFESGTNQKYLNLSGIRKMKLVVPPLQLQQEFARRVEAIEQLKVTHRESLAQLDALFASLQHRAFRGEL